MAIRETLQPLIPHVERPIADPPRPQPGRRIRRAPDDYALMGMALLAGPANVIGHVDRVLGMLESGRLDPTPLVTAHMSLDDAPEAYAIYDRHEALKIVLAP